MATKKQYDRFQRGEKRTDAARHGTYTKNVSRNAAKKERAVLNSAITCLLFCAILPPYGIYRVWTQRNNTPFVKLVCTFVAALVMFLWFMLIIPGGKPTTISVSTTRATALTE